MRTWGALSAIALNTFRETVRDRVLYAIVVFALLSTFAALIFGSLSVQQDVRILQDLGLFTITAFGGVIAIFVGTNLVFKEIDRRTIFLIFTKPIRRWEFITGKFLGLALCIFVVCLAMGLFLSGLAWYETGAGVGAEAGGLIARMVGSVGLIYIELILVIALATFFSTFSTPLMSMLFTLGLWFCGHLSDSLIKLGQMSQNPAAKLIAPAVGKALPDLALLTRIRGDVLDGRQVSGELISNVALYVLLYTALLLIFATVIAERREFQ